MENPLAQLAAPASIALVAVALGLLYRNLPSEKRLGRSLAHSALTVILGCGVWLVVGVPFAGSVFPALLPALTALAGLAALVASLAIREAGAGGLVVAGFAVLWSALVFVPVTIAMYSIGGMLEQFGYFPLDHGGAIPALVAPGAAAVAVMWLNRGMPRSGPASRSTASIVLASGVAFIGWMFWLTSMELAIDEATPRILLNVALAGALGLIGWLIVQRIHHDTATLSAASAGLVSGLASITAGAAYLDPLWAGVTGLVAGVLAATFVHRRVRLSGRASWFLVGAHAIAPAVGLALLGLFAEDIGMMFTGQPNFLGSEAVVSLAVFGYSLAVSMVLGLGSRVIPEAARLRSRDPGHSG